MIYETLIIGSGYSSLGFAAARQETVIIEEREFCDVSFSLGAKSFSLGGYEERTEGAKALKRHFTSIGALSGVRLNATALESAFCAFVLERRIDIRLKSRVIKAIKDGDVYDVSVISNAGIEHFLARAVIDMRARGGTRQLTALFTAEEGVPEAVKKEFSDGAIEEAFYKNRYALHLRFGEASSYADALLSFTERWESAAGDAKLLYISPVFSEIGVKGELPRDSDTDNPLEAFDSGYEFGAKLGRV